MEEMENMIQLNFNNILMALYGLKVLQSTRKNLGHLYELLVTKIANF